MNPRDKNEVADFVIYQATEKDADVIQKLFIKALQNSNPELATVILENANTKRIPLWVDDFGPLIQAIQTDDPHLVELVCRFYINHKLTEQEEAEIIRQALRGSPDIVESLLRNYTFSPRSYKILMSHFPDTIDATLFEAILPYAVSVKAYPEGEQIEEWLKMKPKNLELIKLLVKQNFPYSGIIAAAYGITQSGLQIVSAQQFRKTLEENKTDFSFCNLEPYKLDAPIRLEKPMTLPKKQGQSLTQILVGSITHTFTNFLEEKVQQVLPIIMKVFIDANSDYTFEKLIECEMMNSLDFFRGISTSLTYEANVYRLVFDKIISKNLSPNFISLVDADVCKFSSVAKFMEPTRTVDKFMNPFITEYGHLFMYNGMIPDWAIRMGIIVTESASNGARFGFQSDNLPVKSLWDTFGIELKRNQTTADFWKVMLQVVYSLAVMGKFKINHNDLHPRNILVVELPEPIDMIFQVGKTQYAVNTKFVPYIFDWDFAYVNEFGPNPSITDFDFLSNKFSPKRDLYILMCYLFGSKTFGEEFVEYSHATMKEKEHTVNLTDVQALELAYYAEQKDIKDEKFKMTGEELNKIVPGTVDPSVKKLMFTRQGNQIQFYTGYPCRPTLISSDFPTPRKFLKNEVFDQFKIPYLTKQEIKENGTKFYYKLSTRKDK